MTGLLNRAGFASALEGRRDRAVTLVCLDLDGFKVINDRFGHAKRARTPCLRAALSHAQVA